MAACLFIVVLKQATLGRLLYPVALAFGIASMATRKNAIGGWLLYFYYWMFAFLTTYVLDVALHPSVFLTHEGQKPEGHLALILAAFPRLLACAATVVFACLLLHYREWNWVEKLRLSLLVTCAASFVSVIIDSQYFPTVVLPNAARCAGVVLWTLYFYKSERVERVFRTHDWHPNEQLQMTTDS